MQPGRLVDRAVIAERTMAFWFEPEGGFSFTAGQTCDVTIPDPMYRDDSGNARTFSIASLPSEPRLMFGTRMGGSAFKRTLAEAPLGLRVELDGPYGSFTLHHNAAKPAVFLAGGIGITPFHSMIADVSRRRLPHRITLLYANTSASSAPFLDELERWGRENANFRLAATITAPVTSEPWPFDTGRIDAAFVKTHVQDPGAAVFYIAGPARFVEAMGSLVTAIGADPDSVKSEEFPGYEPRNSG